MREITIQIFDVLENEPADGSLVLGWSATFHNPEIMEYRKKKGFFYKGEMPASVRWFIYLSDIVGLEQTQAMRDRIDQRNDRTKKRILER